MLYRCLVFGLILGGVVRCEAQGAWAPAPQMLSARDAHALAAAGGKVWVLGGRTRPTGATTAQVEAFADGAFRGEPWMEDARSFFAPVVLADGRVLAAGGYRSRRGTTADAELLDPRSGAWRRTGAMRAPRELCCATLLRDGRVLATGGFSNDDILASAELYDPRRGRFSLTAPMGAARFGHVAALLPDGRVLVAGGSAGKAGSQAGTELYAPRDRRWSPGPPMAQDRFRHTLTVLHDGRMLVTGGFCTSQNRCLDTAELYDPRSGSFRLLASRMSDGRMDHTATLLPDGRVLVVGGWSSAKASTVASADIFDPVTETFTPAAPLPVAVHEHAAIALPDGAVLVSGGLLWNAKEQRTLAEAWIYRL